MDITTRQENDVSIMRVVGSMDATTVELFDVEWKRLLQEGALKLVVEMDELEYISSAGLRGILMLAKTAKTKGVKLAFAGMRDMVSDMFRLSGFLTILTVEPDAATAVEHF